MCESIRETREDPDWFTYLPTYLPTYLSIYLFIGKVEVGAEMYLVWDGTSSGAKGGRVML